MTTSEWRPGDPIGYIRPERPEVDIPAYSGQRYEALVPDTLDLQERAALAIHVMTECTNPEADYEVYWTLKINANPPKMSQNHWQAMTVAKFQEALVLNRLMTGSDQNLHVDRRWMEVMLQSQGPDGLIYSPLRGRPWVERALPDFGVSYESGQYVAPFGIGRTLSTMSVFARRDGGTLWRDAARGVADGLRNLAVDAGDYAFFWPNVAVATRDYPAGVTAPHREGADQSRAPHGLVHAYRLLGYEPALHLARKLLTFTRRTYFMPDGTFLSQPGDTHMAHFHSHSHALLTMQEYAEVSGDEDMMQFALRGFDFARRVGGVTNPTHPSASLRGTPGANLIGFFPEYVDTLAPQGSEICEVSDMIALALRFSEAGVGDFWDDADRWARNMLAEGQLLYTDWIPRFSAKYARSAVGEHETTDRVTERALGSFASWPTPNDWYIGDDRRWCVGTTHCCTANGARVLYWLWDRILRYQDGKLRVNLLLNRASKWADVDSYIPYQGRVEVKIKQPVDLSVRIPEWVKPADARCQVNGADRGVTWNGRYAQVGHVNPNDVVTLTFPIFERTDPVYIERQAYTLVRKGNEVVAMDPPGRYCPLFQRQHYRTNSPRWRKITRFVSDRTIEW